jgi:8-oxo-dGTP pyrophosphatase MutT (NUDIX family)
VQRLKLEFNFHQSGVLPYRKKNGELQVLLITSMKRKKWILPKGYIEFNLSPFESAKKEAYEEAGIIGTNETVELGSFRIKSPIGVCDIKIYSMEVIEVLDEYPEKNLRKRKWFTVKEATETISISEVSGMILSLNEKIKNN